MIRTQLIRNFFSNCIRCWAVAVMVILLTQNSFAQQPDSLSERFSLSTCVSYALNHQPIVIQAQLDQEITDRSVKLQLADWYPQAGINYNIQHYLKRPAVTAPLTVRNSSATSVALTQNIFNSNLLLATKTAKYVRLNAAQNSSLAQIAVVVAVSKSFYDVLICTQQIKIIEEDILRLQKTVHDTKYQYEAGTVDKTDYKRAVIALNNSLAAKKRLEESFTAKNVVLKQQIGYQKKGSLNLIYDDQKLLSEMIMSSADSLYYKNRVEFQQLKTQQILLDYNLKSTKWNYLPTVSAFANYNLVAQNKQFTKIYNDFFPNTLIGITFSVPLFQGGKRIQATRLAKLALQRLDLDFQNLVLAINTEYSTALASYNSSMNDYLVSKENSALAQEVFNTIQLQYQSGVKTYLELIIAETDLRSAEVNTLNALYQVLSSKLDVQQAAGSIHF